MTTCNVLLITMIKQTSDMISVIWWWTKKPCFSLISSELIL